LSALTRRANVARAGEGAIMRMRQAAYFHSQKARGAL
jgi:hypothetical protein